MRHILRGGRFDHKVRKVLRPFWTRPSMKNVILTKSRFLGLDFVRIPSTVCIKDFVGYPTQGNLWWAEMDANHRPLGYQPSALPS